MTLNYSKRKSISFKKQIFHAYFPLVFIFFLPKGFLTLGIALLYFLIAGYFYLKKIENKYPEREWEWEYFMINGFFTALILGLYANGL